MARAVKYHSGNDDNCDVCHTGLRLTINEYDRLMSGKDCVTLNGWDVIASKYLRCRKCMSFTSRTIVDYLRIRTVIEEL